MENLEDFLRRTNAKQIEATEINDVVTFEKILGKGSFGSVYKGKLKIAIQAPNGTVIRVGEEVAIKKQIIQYAAHLEQFANEILALKKAMMGECSEVYQIYDIFLEENAPDKEEVTLYIIAELVKGVSGDKLNIWSWSEKKIWNQIVVPIVKGIQCLHDNGIVHRDIKLENIMFDENKKEAKLIDLGVSCIGVCRNVAGTLYTMAPEIVFHANAVLDKQAARQGLVRLKLTAEAEIVDVINIPLKSWIKADYWSLGCTLFKWITHTTYPIQMKVQNGEVYTHEDVARASQEIEEQFREMPNIQKLLKKLLEVDPEKRVMLGVPSKPSLPPQSISTRILRSSQNTPLTKQSKNLRASSQKETMAPFAMKAFAEHIQDNFDMGLINENTTAEALVAEFLSMFKHYKDIDTDKLQELAHQFLTEHI